MNKLMKLTSILICVVAATAFLLARRSAARRPLAAWGRWGQLGRKQFGVLFVGREKFAESVGRHLDGIPTHGKHRVTDAFRAGLHSVFRIVKSRARDFRSFEYSRTKLYLVAG